MKRLLENLKSFHQLPYHTKTYLPIVLIILQETMLIILGYCLYFTGARGQLRHPHFYLALILLLSSLGIALIGFVVRFIYIFIIKNALRIDDIMKAHPALVIPDAEKSFENVLSYILKDFGSAMEQEFSHQLLQKQAEYTALRNQINPHFLYNTLDSIRGYAISEDAPVTADTIEVLSRIFRYTVSSKNDIITLDQELSILNDYVKIHQYRTNKSFQLEKNIEVPNDLLFRYKVPKLILQPFIENAIKHGLLENQANSRINIHIYRTQSRLIISISDNGKGMGLHQLNQINDKFRNDNFGDIAANSQPGKGSGIALTNVNARIKLHFGEDYGVYAYSTFGMGTEFIIHLPLGA